MTRKISVKAYREGKWWTFEIPELGAPAPSGNGAFMMPVGQTRAAAKVAEEARGLAALWEDGDAEDFEVSVTFVLPEEITTAQHTAEELEARGRAELDEAAQLRRKVVRALLADDVSQVDAAAVLGISRQRVQQLA
ncbi:antitoxin HicB [Brevibacterium oceani]|uniref:antitoxin HicB n=1 Tax=Brevibacterium oceani TaxID=358099 RepID=UPI0015E716E2|nr:antitoxin HicB [Brevibacterium oceani]